MRLSASEKYPQVNCPMAQESKSQSRHHKGLL